ncbi:MAG: metallophosphoesterase [Bacillota bacterium]|nr:metallophosphoesterase [Bacillota bacterium]
MALFAIADLHLSLGTSKPMDIFGGWNDYVERIKNNWKAVVKDDDTVVIGGDISWAMKLEESEKDFEFIELLPGKKIILKGNHDYWWGTKKKISDFLSSCGFQSISVLFNSAELVENIAVCGTRGWFYDAESDFDKKIINREIGRLKASIEEALKLNGEPVVFLHYPPTYDNQDCEDILNVLIEYNIKKCYYGHLHGGNAFSRAVIGTYKNIDFHLISSDYTGFRPVLVR